MTPKRIWTANIKPTIPWNATSRRCWFHLPGHQAPASWSCLLRYCVGVRVELERGTHQYRFCKSWLPTRGWTSFGWSMRRSSGRSKSRTVCGTLHRTAWGTGFLAGVELEAHIYPAGRCSYKHACVWPAENEKRLIKKCRELNSEIVSAAAKVQSALKLSEDDQITITALKTEIENSWRMVDESHDKVWRQHRCRCLNACCWLPSWMV